MLSKEQRTTILELHTQKVSKGQIARLLGISRLTVRKVIRSESAEIPEIHRPEKAEPHRQKILELYSQCKGNLVRVHEELAAEGVSFSYQALTAFCRRQGIGTEPQGPVGRYVFEPGEEAQHDTSPHDVQLGGKKRRVQTASLTLAFSRLLFFQCYPTFQRFDCKVFLTDALRYMGGVPQRMMIDNTHVVILRGTGPQMVPVPEMEAFGERFGFRFAAHHVGDPNRKGRVERPFHFIENNFLAGRSFKDWDDLNTQAAAWCDRVNATYKKHIRAVPRELWVLERTALQPLPAWIPEPYRLLERTVDVEGYVSVNTNRYPVPVDWIGRRVEVRETKRSIEIQRDARSMITHRRVLEPLAQRIANEGIHPPRGKSAPRPDPHPEEKTILQIAPEIAEYLVAVKGRSKVPALVLRQLLRLVREYPRGPLVAAVREASQYGLYDLGRLERMILRRVAREFFVLEIDDEKDPTNEND